MNVHQQRVLSADPRPSRPVECGMHLESTHPPPHTPLVAQPSLHRPVHTSAQISYMHPSAPGPDVGSVHFEAALPQRGGGVEEEQPAEEDLDACRGPRGGGGGGGRAAMVRASRGRAGRLRRNGVGAAGRVCSVDTGHGEGAGGGGEGGQAKAEGVPSSGSTVLRAAGRPPCAASPQRTPGRGVCNNKERKRKKVQF